MLAMAVGQKPHAFAACVRWVADADIVTGADARAMHCEAPAADFAGNFAKRVVACLSFCSDGECRHPTPVRRMDKPNGSRGRIRHSGFSVPRGR
jgi:hypothetical protein